MLASKKDIGGYLHPLDLFGHHGEPTACESGQSKSSLRVCRDAVPKHDAARSRTVDEASVSSLGNRARPLGAHKALPRAARDHILPRPFYHRIEAWRLLPCRPRRRSSDRGRARRFFPNSPTSRCQRSVEAMENDCRDSSSTKNHPRLAKKVLAEIQGSVPLKPRRGRWAGVKLPTSASPRVHGLVLPLLGLETLLLPRMEEVLKRATTGAPRLRPGVWGRCRRILNGGDVMTTYPSVAVQPKRQTSCGGDETRPWTGGGASSAVTRINSSASDADGNVLTLQARLGVKWRARQGVCRTLGLDITALVEDMLLVDLPPFRASYNRLPCGSAECNGYNHTIRAYGTG